MTSSKWRDFEREPALDPELPIIDSHHHIWGPTFKNPRFKPYDINELCADVMQSGHNIVATVLVDSHAQYFTEGPVAMRPVGETVEAERVSREAAERLGGRAAGLCAAIVTHADLCLGAAVGEVLDAHAAASSRFRGIRHMMAIDPELPPIYGTTEAGISKREGFRAGFAQLAARGLSFEAWVLEPQLPEIVDLARSFPDTPIVLNHLGGRLNVGPYAGRGNQGWRESMRQLAACDNVTVKLGGLYVTHTEPAKIDFPPAPISSEEFAAIHRETVLAAINLFTPSRCMFESNFPVDMLYTSYDTLWNGYKRVVADFSADERAQMFAGVARRVYRIPGG